LMWSRPKGGAARDLQAMFVLVMHWPAAAS